MLHADIRVVKRRRSAEKHDDSIHSTKRFQSYNTKKPSVVLTKQDKQDFLQTWLDTSCLSHGNSANSGTSLQNVSDNMPRPLADRLASPEPSGTSSLPSSIRTKESKETKVSAVSSRGPGYRTSLRHRNIYVYGDHPPATFMQEALDIISRARNSPELDDEYVSKTLATLEKLESAGEGTVIHRLAQRIIPATSDLPDDRLESSHDQVWSRAVPVPLSSAVLDVPRPLPKPKPDLLFGYSETAFTENQINTMDVLVDKDLGGNYAIPDDRVRFPFLDIEYKSLAKTGSQAVATNQTAGAGAIALNGILELMRRCGDANIINFHVPKFFSVTMDQLVVLINVHWFSKKESGQYKFQLRRLAKHFVDDAESLREVRRSIKNILDYGIDKHPSGKPLKELCDALDAYRVKYLNDKAAEEKAAANAAKDQATSAQTAQQSRKARRPARQQVEEILDHVAVEVNMDVEDIAFASVEGDEAEAQEAAAPPKPAQRRSGRKPTPTRKPARAPAQRSVHKSTSPPARQPNGRGVIKKAPAKARAKSLAKTMHVKRVTKAMEAVTG
jgi:pyruvate/2-oxoglutarate dehydrogenase complex dihydrolipoamide acyltransferase (E2) component